MAANDDQIIFAALVHEDIERLCAEASVDDAMFKEDQFTKYVIDILVPADQLEDGTLAYYPKSGMKVNGYHFNEVEDSLDLLICSDYSGTDPPPTFAKSDVDALFAKGKKFFQESLKGLHKKIDESSEAFYLAQQIHTLPKRSTSQIRFFLFLDGFTRVTGKNAETYQGFSYSFHVFDLKELQLHRESGKERKPVDINFKEEFGQSIPFLPVVECDKDFEACVALMPGKLLCEIYAVYGSRLLERNIRAFLRATGKINRQIKKTIMETPGRFLAYNNGISCTAEAIEWDFDQREMRIKSIKNFQIVNGGQTTSSLYNAYKRNKADLSKVYVQAKISIIKDPAIIDATVSKISLYANSQNKVSESDFYALDTFHVRVEEFSRNTWAPPEAGKPKLSKWYYERARGAYLDDRSRTKKVSAFDEEYPKARVFTKTELAIFESVWSELPHNACLGEQKNFSAFTIRAGKEGITVDQQYFKELVAKCILYRAAEGMVKALKLPAYKAQTAKYSLAFILNKMRSHVDLADIWKRQSPPTWMVSALRMVIPVVHKRLSESEGGKNVTEWCKKESCWQTIQNLPIELESFIPNTLIKSAHPDNAVN